MAAVSAPHAATALTPPSSSHGRQSSWSYSLPGQNQEQAQHSKNRGDKEFTQVRDRQPLSAQVNGLPHSNSRPKLSSTRSDTFTSSHSAPNLQADTYLTPARITALTHKESYASDTGSASDSLLDLYGSPSANRSGVNSMDFGERKGVPTADNEEDPESSRWIHRDKLARIESQELQAAGIVLPRSRAYSKTGKKDRDLSNGRGDGQSAKRQRVGSIPTEETGTHDTSFDLRLPEEAAEDYSESYKDYGSLSKGSSKIPLSKTSPLPIPIEYIERDTPTQRVRSNGWTGNDDPIAFPKARPSSVQGLEELTTTSPAPAPEKGPDSSPTKKAAAPAVRKGSIPAKITTSRPGTRSGPNRDASGARPTTRSGELGPSGSVKRPEGDPPWLATMYKPDPRLPPDQQMIPTVAKRLQQEQWEKEGKFGTAYDKDFRPLNDEEWGVPSIAPQVIDAPEPSPGLNGEWPLKGGPKSPTLSTGRPGTAGVGSYSTIPKIQTPTAPVQSPRTAGPLQPIRVQEPPEETKKKGCGCCIVM